jgi:superkiller protein 8
MSKQYLAEHTIDDAHRIDIYSLAVTPTQIISASGESSLKVYSTKEPDFPIAQVLKSAHKLGCHHVVTSIDGRRAASVGFGGEAKIWLYDEGMWKEDGEIVEAPKAGELWAVTLSAEGRYLAGTTYDGRINVWGLDDGRKKFLEYETKGSFGMSIDLVSLQAYKSPWRSSQPADPSSPLMEASQQAATRAVMSTSSAMIRAASYILYRAW